MHWKEDLKSKINDGLMTALILVVLLTMCVLLVRPIQILTGRPGLLIYTLSLMALSVYCLEHSLQPARPDTSHAWFGMAGGLLGWISISLSNDIGSQRVDSATSVLVLILFALVATRLWRKHLPVGGKLYCQTILLAWSGQLYIESRPGLTALYPSLGIVYHGFTFVFIIGVLLTVWIIFNQTDRRLQRILAAPWLAFFIAMTIFSMWLNGSVALF